MPGRRLVELVQDVLRECRGQATQSEAQQAVQDALNVIDASANWEFLLTTRMIRVYAPYTTGTVSCAAGSTNVTLSGGSWNTFVSPGVEYREIKFASRQMPYKLAQMPTATSAILQNPLSGDAYSSSTDIVGDAYTLYQARYPLPSDCEPGRDLCLKGPLGTGIYFDGNIKKRERMIYDRKTSELRMGFNAMYYTDDEFDETLRYGTIRIEPYPDSDAEYRLTYYRKLTVPQTTNQQLMIPEAFERAPILMAASNILRKKNMPGWQTMRQEAGDLLNKMYNRYASSAAYEGKIDPSYDDLLDDNDDMFAANSLMYGVD